MGDFTLLYTFVAVYVCSMTASKKLNKLANRLDAKPSQPIDKSDLLVKALANPKDTVKEIFRKAYSEKINSVNEQLKNNSK
jgi:hypothetical protein